MTLQRHLPWIRSCERAIPAARGEEAQDQCRMPARNRSTEKLRVNAAGLEFVIHVCGCTIC